MECLELLRQSPAYTMLGTFREDQKDPFYMLIATILSARAKDETTMPIADTLLKKYPTPEKLAVADEEDVQKIIKKIGFYRNKASMVTNAAKMLITDFDGKVPESMEDLLMLPGVGRKVAGCVRVYAFGLDSIPVDTHVHRISNRLGWVNTKTPEQTEQQLMKKVPKDKWKYINDYLVHHGKTVCKPIGPLCNVCILRNKCNHAAKNL